MIRFGQSLQTRRTTTQTPGPVRAGVGDITAWRRTGPPSL